MKRFYILCLLGILPYLGLSQIPLIELQETGDFVEAVEILADTVQDLSASNLLRSGQFEEIDPTQSFSLDHETYWVRFVLKNENTTTEDWIIEFDKDWHEIDLYAETDQGLTAPILGGCMRTQKAKAFPKRSEGYIPLRIESGEERLCLARLHYDKGYPLFPSTIAIRIASREQVLAEESRLRGMLNFFLGVFFIMFFYHLNLYYATRDKNYLYYLLILLVTPIGTEFSLGYMVPYFRTIHEMGPLAMTVGSLTFASLAFFTRNFLQLPQHSPRLNKILLGLVGLQILVPVTAFSGNLGVAYPILGLSLLVGLLFLLYVSIWAYRKQIPSSVIFLVGQAFTIVTYLILPMFILNLLPLAHEAYLIQPIGQTCQIIVFSFALGNRIKGLREENQMAQTQILETERKNTRLEKEKVEQLKKLDRLKDQFLANTSHELRTPLNGIIGISESLIDRAQNLSAKEIRENLSMVVSSGKRLANLVNDLLDFSKLKNQDLTLQEKALDLHAITEFVLTMLSPLVRGKPVELRNEVPKDFPPVEGDENRLIQVLNNLVGNAIKFTSKGRVSVTVSSVGDEAQVAVSDTGIGIPEDKQSLIFQEFEQGDGSIRRAFAGTGLGLSISKRLIELHRGKMWVESTVGEGATFYFTLPFSQETVAQESTQLGTSAFQVLQETSEEEPVINLDAEKPSAMARVEGATVKILMVDDEPINLQVLKNHLIGRNCAITTASNGMEALNALNGGEKFDLVLLDVMMPKMSGFEVCEKIREKYLPSELPILMITAKNQVSDLVEGLTVGANDYIAKPFSKSEFLARVKTHLNLHRINTFTGRFVPYEFVRSLGKETITDIQLGDHVEKEVTVVFSDIRDYTRISEQLSPEATFGLVTAYSRRLGPVIERNEGFVNQFQGDGIMALFLRGAEDAIKAAIEMQKVISEYNQTRIQRGWEPLRMGIGMDTGKLIMGIIGDEKRNDATTISDTVNTASRMEGMAKFFRASVIVSGDTLKKADDLSSYHYRYLGKVQVKGKERAKEIYEFFDGDEPAIWKLKMKIKPIFEQGLKHYLREEFAEGARLFKQAMTLYPEDFPSTYYWEKCTAYLNHGIPEDWAGVESMSNE